MTDFDGSPSTVGAGPLQGLRARDEGAHERNLRLRRSFMSLVSASEACTDVSEAESLRSRAAMVADEFVAVNRGLAVSQAGRFSAATREDYSGAALHGLYEAFLRWDPDRGVAFSTFSRPFISGRLQRAVRQQEFSHLSQNDFALRARALRAWSDLAESSDGDPSFEAVAGLLDVPAEQVARVLAPQARSLDRRLSDDGSELHETLPDDRVADLAELLAVGADLSVLLACLDDPELWLAHAQSGLFASEPLHANDVGRTTRMERGRAGKASTAAAVKLARAAVLDSEGRVPSVSELSELTGVPDHRVEEVLESSERFSDLRGSLARMERAVGLLRARGSSREAMVRAERHRQELLDRVFSRLAPLVAELSEEFGHVGPDGVFDPADPEDVVADAWELFLSWDVDDRRSFESTLRRRIAGWFVRRPKAKGVTPPEPLPLTSSDVRRCVLRADVSTSERLFGRVAPLVAELSEEFGHVGPDGGFTPAEPEDVISEAWDLFRADGLSDRRSFAAELRRRLDVRFVRNDGVPSAPLPLTSADLLRVVRRSV